MESGNPLAFGGIACLLISALLTAIYMLSVVVRSYFPKAQAEMEADAVRDPSWLMCLPLLVCAFCVLALGFWSEPLIDFFQAIALGME